MMAGKSQDEGHWSSGLSSAADYVLSYRPKDITRSTHSVPVQLAESGKDLVKLLVTRVTMNPR